eukprot:UN24101
MTGVGDNPCTNNISLLPIDNPTCHIDCSLGWSPVSDIPRDMGCWNTKETGKTCTENIFDLGQEDSLDDCQWKVQISDQCSSTVIHSDSTCL